MANARFTSVDEYLAAQPKSLQDILRRVRGAIRKAVPQAEETLSYGIPTYKLNGRPVLYFAGWKQHYSIYPSTAALVVAFKDQLSPYDVNGKGTIRFPLSEPVPSKLIADIAKFRAAEVARARKTGAVGPKKRSRVRRQSPQRS